MRNMILEYVYTYIIINQYITPLYNFNISKYAEYKKQWF